MQYSCNKLGIHVVKMLWDVLKYRRNSFSTFLKYKTYVKTVEHLFLLIWGKILQLTASAQSCGCPIPGSVQSQLWAMWPSERCLCPQQGSGSLRSLPTQNTLWFYDSFDFIASSLKIEINVKKWFVVVFFNPILKIFLPSIGKKPHNNGNVSSCAYSGLRCIFDISVLLLVYKLRN